MSGEVIRKEPTATVTWPLGPVSADSVKLSASLNLNPLVEFSAFSGDEAAQKSNKVLNTDASTLMGRAQQITHSTRNAPDCSVLINDGVNTLNFSGFLSGPNYRMNKGMIAPGFSIVAAATIISNLKLDIYNFPGGAKDIEAMSKGIDTVAHLVTEGNLAARLSQLTRGSIDYWLRHRDDVSMGDTPLSADYKGRRDEANRNGPLQGWRKLLENSEQTLDNDWLKQLQRNRAANTKFNVEMLTILRGTSRDFLDVIASIMGCFQLAMVPARDGGPGKFITLSSMLTASPVPLVLPASTLFLQGDSRSSLLPVQQVVVKDLPKARAKQGEMSSQAFQLTGGASIVGAFPLGVESSAGDVEFVPLPTFLSTLVSWTSPQVQGRGSSSPTLEELKRSVMHLTNQVVQFQDTTVNKLIQDYAKSLYVDRALGFTRTSVQVPLDLSLWPGERYRVTNSRGELLFNGFLSGIQHSLEKKAMGGGSAPTTTLDFTHIEFPGFTLPGLA